MHIRAMTKKAMPAPAVNIEQLLFIANGLVGLIGSIFSVGTSGITFYDRVLNFEKPTE